MGDLTGRRPTSASRLYWQWVRSGFLWTWLPTPNYNTLALQALLLAGIGAVIADAAFSRVSMAGWILIGTGGWLAFMAKPTTAGALGFVVLIYLLASRKWNWRLLLLASAWSFVLVLLTIWIIDGSVVDFIEHFKRGLEDAARLGAGHTIDRFFRFDDFSIEPSQQTWMFGLSLVVMVSTYLVRSSNDAITDNRSLHPDCDGSRLHVRGYRLYISPISRLAISTDAVLVHVSRGIGRGSRYGALSIDSSIRTRSLDIGSLLCLDAPRLCLRHRRKLLDRRWGGGVFWVLTSVVLFGIQRQRQTAWRSLLPIAVTSLLVTAMLIDVGIQHPYRQIQSLNDFTGTLRFAGSGGELRVSAETANYIGQLESLANGAGFRIGDPIIDLTGENPGALYALGARAVGAAWLIGGYRGSNDWTLAVLSRVPCDELVRAWILTEPDGRRHLSSDVLRRYGVDINRDYVEVGAVDSTTGSDSTSYKQHLLKPIRPPETSAVCKSSR